MVSSVSLSPDIIYPDSDGKPMADSTRQYRWIRQGETLIAIASMETWVSPRLGIRFTQVNGDLEIYGLDGRRFLSSIEMARRAELEQARAEVADQQAEFADQRADQLASQVRSAATNLLGLGLSSEQVATAFGLPLDEVNAIGLEITEQT